jgi:DNA mismatch repair protein MSH4
MKALNKTDFDKLIASVFLFNPYTTGLSAHIQQLAASEAKESSTAKPASARVVQMLNLRNVVRNLPLLRKALEGSRLSLLQYICEVSTYSLRIAIVY